MKYSLLFASILIVVTTSVGMPQQNKMESRQFPITVCYASDENAHTIVPAPAKALLKSTNTVFDVKYSDSFSDEAKACFNKAMQIWASLINTNIPIRIKANWSELENGVLGSAGPTSFFRNFKGAPKPNTWYPIALTEKILEENLNDDGYDIYITFNSSHPNWSYRTDGVPVTNKHDLVTVVLHEIGHGLGFYSSADTTANVGTWSFGDPITFDHFMFTGDNKYILDTAFYPDNSIELLNVFTGNNLYFNSPYSNSFNNDNPFKLYAPYFWNTGSSISHLDESTYPAGNLNALMTPQVARAEVHHSPGHSIGIFNELGWIYGNILHDSLKDTENMTDSIFFISRVKSDVHVFDTSVQLHYLMYPQDSIYHTSTMLKVSGDTFKITLPPSGTETYFRYYITASDSTFRTYKQPSGHDSSFYSFTIGMDEKLPVITHTPIEFVYELVDSIEFEATVTDNIGVDSVYIQLYLNNTLVKSNGFNESPDDLFKSKIAMSALGATATDTIFYEIVAIDASLNKNTQISEKYTIDIRDLPEPVAAYATPFDIDTSLWLLDGFSITNYSGFSGYALHSQHPYKNSNQSNVNFNFTAQLKIPIIITNDTAGISWREIVLVEPGEKSSGYGDEDMWDYVIIEGSNDFGTTWIPLLDGYDSREKSNWLTAYETRINSSGNSLTIGNESLYKSNFASFTANNHFEIGDKLLIRFRLFSDQLAVGWGWAIDDIEIPGKQAVSIPNAQTNNINIYPNPANNYLFINASTELEKIVIVDLFGKTVKNIPVENQATTKVNIEELSTGVYFVQIQLTNGQVMQQKVLVY